MNNILIKKMLLSTLMLCITFIFLPLCWAETENEIVSNFQEEMNFKYGIDCDLIANSFLLEKEEKYLSCKAENLEFDFNDGQGLVEIKVKVRVQLNDLVTYINDGNDFNKFDEFDGFDAVKNYKFWAITSSQSSDKLFFYPALPRTNKGISNEEALSNLALSEDENGEKSFIFLTASDHGILYLIDKEKNLHRAILHHYLISPNETRLSKEERPELGTVAIFGVGDLNGDGLNDYKITYSDGYQQIAYYQVD